MYFKHALCVDATLVDLQPAVATRWSSQSVILGLLRLDAASSRSDMRYIEGSGATPQADAGSRPSTEARSLSLLLARTATAKLDQRIARDNAFSQFRTNRSFLLQTNRSSIGTA
ncbi:hypothetical protein HN011_002061 [Eciton burchellii]|nr:hypothetical protein HN011_002061 [Eciton burchellii]